MSAEAFSFEPSSAIDALDVGVIIVDRQGRIVAWNEWIARFTRKSPASVLGHCLAELFPALRATRLPAAIEESFQVGSSSILTHSLNKLLPLTDDNGNELLHNVIVRPISSGATQQCLLQITDVTIAVTRERVLRERQNARYHAIADTAPDAIITIDLQLSIQWINGAAVKIFGYAPEELLGRRIHILLENENDLTRSFLDTIQRTGQTGSTLQITGRRKNGTPVPFEMSMARWSAEDRVFITTIWRDVTDRLLAEKAVRESEARLRRNNEELEVRVAERTREREAALAQLFESQKLETIGQLTGGVAHDFNNLLSVILGSLALLKKRLPDDPRIARLLDGAIQGAERGATLTGRLLAFARRQELKLAAVEMQALVADITDFLRQSVGPGVRIVIDIPADVDPVVTDANQLELALMNLAVNARDAMPQGGTLTIKCRNEVNGPDQLPATLPVGEYVRLTVADSGVGMDEATRGRALEPFFTTKGIGKGTGLGLSMVHGLIVQSGGAMDITSRIGEGTAISLWLPRARREDVQRAAPPSRERRGGEVPALRILLVDDDVLVSMNTANMLMDLGHEVVEAHSAGQALQVLDSQDPFDVVITDYAMPGMNGFELATKISARDSKTVVILATGYADLPVSSSIDFPRLSKPYSQDQLSRVLENCVLAPR